MIGRLVSEVWWRRYFRRNARSWEELEQFPHLRADRQRLILAERLMSQIQFFGNREDAFRSGARQQRYGMSKSFGGYGLVCRS